MDILDPAGTSSPPSRTLARRPGTLAGRLIGVLDNSKPNAGALLERVARDLQARLGARGVRVWRKPGASMPAAPALIEEIASTCGAVLTGSAD
ncbi:MAG TPA: hypothetical protein VEL75_14240 [Candidatus Methylomirabilis sp.]|nr:hypothetical protein [Candidatus Methylomirabilis sp.]